MQIKGTGHFFNEDFFIGLLVLGVDRVIYILSEIVHCKGQVLDWTPREGTFYSDKKAKLEMSSTLWQAESYKASQQPQLVVSSLSITGSDAIDHMVFPWKHAK